MKKYIFRQGFVEFTNTYINAKDIDDIVEQAHQIDGDYASKLLFVRYTIVDSCTNLLEDENLKDENSVTKYFELDKKGVIKRILNKIVNADLAETAFDKSYNDMIFKKIESALDVFTEQFANIDVDKQKEDLKNALQELQEVKEEHEAIMHG
jgi:hypothetical protein